MQLVAKHPDYTVTELCVLLGKTKQAYYKRVRYMGNVLLIEKIIIDYARDCREKNPGMGCWKIWQKYNHSNPRYPIGRDCFVEILLNNGFRVRKKTRKPRTTDSNHPYHLYKNLVKDLLLTRCNQVFVSDITYITLWKSEEDSTFCFLSVIMDDYTKEIVGYCVHEDLSTVGALKALQMALLRVPTDHLRLIHHSDRGCQYASTEYVRLLKEHNIDISMTECGNPLDNASSERVNSTIKNELLKGMRFHTIDEVRVALDKAIEFYNNERPHMSLNMKCPVECRDMTGVMEKKWNRKREKYLRPETKVDE